MVKISIIVPIHNSEKYIERCVESLVNQTLKDIEILLIDDASCDSSKSIIMNYEDKYPSLVKGFYLETSRHAGGARNVGIEHAEGEYITFVDSDDFIDEKFCELLFAEAKKGNYDIVFSDFMRGKEQEEGKWFVSVFPEQIGKLTYNKRKSLLINSGYSCGMIIKNRLFKEHCIRYPEQIGCEDYCMRMILFLYTKSVGRVSKPLYHYIIYETSLSHQRNSSRHFDYEKSVDWLNNWLQINPSKEYEDYIITGMARQLLQEIKMLIKYFDELPIDIIKNLALQADALLKKIVNKRLFYMMSFGRELELVANAREDSETLRQIISEHYDVTKQYQMQYKAYHKDILGQLKNWKKDGKEIIIWGAGKKAVSFLQNIKGVEAYINYAADMNQEKWGKKLLEHYLIINPLECLKRENVVWLFLNRRHYLGILNKLVECNNEDKLANMEIIMTLCE